MDFSGISGNFTIAFGPSRKENVLLGVSRDLTVERRVGINYGIIIF